jgi:hypothetical protein
MMRNFVIFEDFDLHLVDIAVNSNLELQVFFLPLKEISCWFIVSSADCERLEWTHAPVAPTD